MKYRVTKSRIKDIFALYRHLKTIRKSLININFTLKQEKFRKCEVLKTNINKDKCSLKPTCRITLVQQYEVPQIYLKFISLISVSIYLQNLKIRLGEREKENLKDVIDACCCKIPVFLLISAKGA